ncbi:hydantoinase/oxoprolinase N-terminal domain-containing protein [Paraglaciecola marina]|uniref:hydantoinase/oxoprolinase N-terminal domain-containing protein n=1 Tax=Paraglaciecola marina TaxID=2500157 RepID=UPI00105BDE8E|nr:hydantoinase/oxoprolinase family protein [Paraglaciecola marina]
MHIGIDVGGTHTDAVLISGDDILASTKALTSADIVTGVVNALTTILTDGVVSGTQIDAIMIGTTQFTNAVVERRELSEVAAIRIGLPSGEGLPPMVDWPADIKAAVGNHAYMIKGGYLYDNWPLAQFDEAEINDVLHDIKRKGLTNISIASAFSPMNPEPELFLAEKVKAVIPEAKITLSHNIGRLGILERENASILNTALLDFADRVVDAFGMAINKLGIQCPVFISQNDGTLMNASYVKKFPALTFASGPTNSLRGAFKLSGVANAIVVDIGGTTSDIGVLQNGFPRESSAIVDIGGIRTNFRMPDINAIGLGGGSMVTPDGLQIGPQSVGHRLVDDGLVFGGDILTATDLIVAAGGAEIGDKTKLQQLSKEVVASGIKTINQMLDRGIDMMKLNSEPVPVILVGGGAVLVSGDLKSASQVLRPKHAEVANAIGASIAKISGESEKMVSYQNIPRDKAIEEVKQEAFKRAIAAGASEVSLEMVDIEETAIPYMDGACTKLRIKVMGDVKALASTTHNKIEEASS